MADLSEQIEEAAGSPQSAESDGQKVQARPIADLIEADKYLSQKQAAQNKSRGIRFTKLVPPGTV